MMNDIQHVIYSDIILVYHKPTWVWIINRYIITYNNV